MRKTYLISIAICVMLASCAKHRPTHFWWSGEILSNQSIDQILASHPLAPDENVRVINLGAVESISHHVVQVRVAESLHVHKEHDLTVLVYRGHGMMMLGDQTFGVAEGDVVFIPRGVPHAFRNESHEPAVAIVGFTPAFDGKDTVPWTKME